MVKSDLSEYFEKAEIPDEVMEKRKDEVILAICRKGVSYPTELARECDLHPEIVNRILFNFKKLGFVEKIMPHPTDPQAVFKAIIPEMWLQAIWGYENFTKFSWWTLTIGGFEYIQAKYEGQHKPIKAGLAMQLGLKEKDE